MFYTKKRSTCSLLSFWITAFALAMLAGCGGGGGGGASGSAVTELPPKIMAHPLTGTFYETQSATFSINASGTGTLSYQWWKELEGSNVEIPGATLATYTATSLTLADNGASFAVDVTGSGGTTRSNAAVLTVQAAVPGISTQPTSQTVLEGQTASFSVTATGLPTLSYQWFKNGTAIAGATAGSYNTPATARADSGQQYSVRVTNGAGTSVDSNAATLTVQPINLTHLVISEVSSCFFSNVNCWFEVFNPTSASVALGSYQVKTSGSTQTFSLPSFSVPANGYVVIAGNTANLSQRSSQMVYLGSGNQVPNWGAHGFIELLNNSGASTVDFVRFGSSTQTPVTASHWQGSSVAALPSSSTDYNKAIVRLYPATATDDTDSNADWVAVNWATPAGRNDVPTTAVDADGDGIPDSAEVAAGTFGGIDLYAMGARTSQKDIFIEVDRMDSTDAGVIPRSESLQKVVDSFAAQSISVHFDAGSLFGSGFSAANFNLGQSNSLVPYEACVTFDQTTCNANTSSRRSIYDWKDEFFDLRRRSIFHYLLFGNSQLATGASGSSGLAEVIGNDLLVTMGNWGATTTPGSQLNLLVNYQASTIMHELGHNLGLRHGGDENANYKPNYWSVMNYIYQLRGLDGNPGGMTAYQRWRAEMEVGAPALCDLANSPCGAPSQFIMDYSNGTSSSLNEASLLEASNIGRINDAGAYADWNLNGALTTSAQVKDLNGDFAQSVLTDHNDWANLVMPFNRYWASSTGVSKFMKTSQPVLNPITADRQAVAEETPPSARFFEELRHAH